MHSRFGENRGIWLVGGVLLGLGISYFWPHEPLRADQADRNDKFAMISVAATTAIAGLPPTESVFILDFVTGRLQGFYLAPNVGNFTQSFYRDVAQDLKLDEKGAAQPVYAMVGGTGQIAGQGGTFGAAIIYVAELNTGSLVAYGYPFTAQNNGVPPQQMIPIAKAQFRQPIAN